MFIKRNHEYLAAVLCLSQAKMSDQTSPFLCNISTLLENTIFNEIKMYICIYKRKKKTVNQNICRFETSRRLSDKKPDTLSVAFPGERAKPKA